MNLLIEPLPKAVKVGGEETPINPDFRLMVRLELLLTEDEEDDGKEQRLVDLLCKILPEFDRLIERRSPTEIFRAVLDFYAADVSEPDGHGQLRTDTDDSDNEGGAPSERVYSFRHDSEVIYAAFMQTYHIDLTRTRLHWRQFRALLRALPQECLFSQIVRYRAVNLADVPKTEREHYRRMKRLYALPLPKSEQEKTDAITEALMNGGDLSGVL